MICSVSCGATEHRVRRNATERNDRVAAKEAETNVFFLDNFLSRIVQFDEVSDNDDDASDYHYFLLLFFENLNEDDRNGKVKCNMVVYSVTCAPCSISWRFS